jgi:hypothetical protein
MRSSKSFTRVFRQTPHRHDVMARHGLKSCITRLSALLKQSDKIENGSLASRPLKTAGDGGAAREIGKIANHSQAARLVFNGLRGNK